MTGGGLTDGTYFLTSHVGYNGFHCSCTSRYTLVLSEGVSKFEWYQETGGTTPAYRASGHIMKGGPAERLYLYVDCPVSSMTPSIFDYAANASGFTWYDYSSKHVDTYVKQ